MTMLQQFLVSARADRPVYISRVRDAFQAEGTRPFHFHVRLYDDAVRRFALKVPACEGAEEGAFVETYLNAMLYNVLSSLGAKRIDIYFDPSDSAMADYVSRLNGIFQVDAPITTRTARYAPAGTSTSP